MTEAEIRAFLTVLQAGNISSAAARLYVTQPALSKRIQALEQELGYRLITRGKGMRELGLTPKGEAFVPVAERYLELWKEAREINGIEQYFGRQQCQYLSVPGCLLRIYVKASGLSAELFELPFSGGIWACGGRQD